jgi:CheY-like chemotaxis protein
MVKETEQLKPLRILLTEGKPLNQKVALRILTKLGYGADIAANCLEVLQDRDRQPYDVVLMGMGIRMPDRDGL